MEAIARGVLDPPVKPGDDGLMSLTAADHLVAR
jgi:hypothetical protein